MGGGKMYTCKNNLTPMLYRGGKKSILKNQSLKTIIKPENLDISPKDKCISSIHLDHLLKIQFPGVLLQSSRLKILCCHCWAWVAAVVLVQSMAQEFTHAVSSAPPPKKIWFPEPYSQINKTKSLPNEPLECTLVPSSPCLVYHTKI